MFYSCFFDVVFFFFKQKTAYEMRISDWSSDVCSSDLHHRLRISDEALDAAARLSARYVTERFLPDKAIDLIDESASRVRMYKSPAAKEAKAITEERSEERRVGKESVSTCRSRWSPYN